MSKYKYLKFSSVLLLLLFSIILISAQKEDYSHFNNNIHIIHLILLIGIVIITNLFLFAKINDNVRISNPNLKIFIVSGTIISLSYLLKIYSSNNLIKLYSYRLSLATIMLFTFSFIIIIIKLSNINFKKIYLILTYTFNIILMLLVIFTDLVIISDPNFSQGFFYVYYFFILASYIILGGIYFLKNIDKKFKNKILKILGIGLFLIVLNFLIIHQDQFFKDLVALLSIASFIIIFGAFLFKENLIYLKGKSIAYIYYISTLLIIIITIIYTYEITSSIKLISENYIFDLAQKQYIKNNINEIWVSSIIIIILIISISISLYYFFTKSLRKEIKSKTHELKKLNSKLESIVKKRTQELNLKSKQLEKLNINLKNEVDKKTIELKNKLSDIQNTKSAILNMMDDLSQANLELKKLDKAKSEFLNIVSHELKTPLTAILAHLEVLDDITINMSSDEKKSLEAIKRNSNNLKMLIGNILEVARMESGNFELTKTKTDLNKIIKDVFEEIQILANQKGLKLILNSDKSIKINIDDSRIKEVINNLLSNAIKFTEKGTITISIKDFNNHVSISVKDTGVGIPKEKMKNLFQRFFQVDASISRRYGGTGLGLSISKKIVEAHDGTINVNSIEGKGTEFTFSIPKENIDKIKEKRKNEFKKYPDPFDKFDKRIKEMINNNQKGGKNK